MLLRLELSHRPISRSHSDILKQGLNFMGGKFPQQIAMLTEADCRVSLWDIRVQSKLCTFSAFRIARFLMGAKVAPQKMLSEIVIKNLAIRNVGSQKREISIFKDQNCVHSTIVLQYSLNTQLNKTHLKKNVMPAWNLKYC